MSAWLVAILAVICGWSVVYLWLGAWLIRRWMEEEISTPETLPPVTLMRSIKPGVPALRDKLVQLARALRAGDQMVLGANAGSAELALCETLRADFPVREIVVVPCRDGLAVNPKISKLLQLAGAVRHERLILSDSEVLIDAAWLDALRAEWETSGADVLTTGYRISEVTTWPQRFDAAVTLLSLWPGLALVRRWGAVNFALGACTALRRRDLEEVGGWAAFGDFLAEDRELGAALAARGRQVRLSKSVTTLQSDPLTWREWWRHQRRVAVTYRVCSPGGFAGMLFTHGTTMACVLALAPAPDGWRLGCLTVAASTFTLRWLAARRLARVLGFGVPGLALAMLVAGLVETVAWVLSWVPRPIWWSGRWWRVSARGRLRPLTTGAANRHAG